MADGQTTRTMAAKLGAGLGFLCGVLGVLAGLTDHMWKFQPAGWFMGGALLTLLAIFVLIEGAISTRRL